MSTTLLFGILPLVAFAIVDSFLGLKAALISALVIAVIECIWTYAHFGEIDQITFFSFALVLIFSLISYRTKNAMFFKIQPAILSAFLAIWLLASWFSHEPMLLMMGEKYSSLLPDQFQQQLTYEPFRQLLTVSTMTLGIGLIFHAMLTVFAALRLSTWWWLAMRGVGFYLFSFLAMLAARFLVWPN